MIIGTYFTGDNDDKLKIIQYDSYYSLLGEWINIAGHRQLRYRTSPEWADVTELWLRFREDGHYDHRCIQMPHDLIAARFRQVAPGMTLLMDEKEYAWCAFFKAEAANWLQHDGFLRSFMIALSASNSRAGYDAEDVMFEMMRQQYNELDYTVSV